MHAPKINKTWFYLLSFTWGLPMTLVGLVTAALLLLAGKRPRRYGRCLWFQVGERWGGMSLGPVFLTGRGASERTRDHECGHSLQNCLYGFLMPFLVAIPSFLRYWARRLGKTLGHAPGKEYDAIWFERQATQWGMACRGCDLS